MTGLPYNATEMLDRVEKAHGGTGDRYCSTYWSISLHCYLTLTLTVQCVVQSVVRWVGGLLYCELVVCLRWVGGVLAGRWVGGAVSWRCNELASWRLSLVSCLFGLWFYSIVPSTSMYPPLRTWIRFALIPPSFAADCLICNLCSL